MVRLALLLAPGVLAAQLPAGAAAGRETAGAAAEAASAEPRVDASGDVLVRPVHVRARGDRAGDERGPAGAAPDAEAARRALDDPAFVTVVRVDAHPAEATPVAEVLARSVGVSVRSFGGLGSFASVSVRGSPAGQTEVLLDGVPLSRLGFSTVDVGALDLGTFARVEVYRGGVPVALGGAVLGGAVNFVTAVGPGPDGLAHTATVGGGSFGFRRTRVARRDRALGGRLRSTVAVGYAGAAGDYRFYDDRGTPLNLDDDRVTTRRNNGYDQLDGVARVRYGTAARSVELGERFSWRSQGVPGPAAAQAEHALLTTLRDVIDLSARAAGALGVPRLDLGARGHVLVEQDHWQDLAGEVGLGRQERGYLTLAGGATLAAGYALGRSQVVTFAADGRAERFVEEDLVAGARHAGRRLGVGLSLGDELVLGADEALVLLPAVRLDVLATRGDGAVDPVIGQVSPGARTDSYLSPRVGARWRVAPGLAVKANAGRYFRAPTLVELFGDRGFLVGNPGLSPETGTAGDVGLVVAPAGRHGAFDRLLLEAAFFTSRSHDLIVMLPAAGRARAQNLGDARLAGHEVALSARVARTVTVSANYTFLDSAQRSPLVSYDGKRLPGRPRHEAYVRVDAARRLGAGRAVQVGGWVDLTLASGSFLDAANLSELPARRFVGAGVRIEPRPHLAVTLEARNLLDETVDTVTLAHPGRPDLAAVPRAVCDVIGYPLPGRALYGAVEWSF